MKKKVLADQHISTKGPGHFTLTCWLLMEVFDYPPVWCGVLGTLLVLLWIHWICSFAIEERISPKEFQ